MLRALALALLLGSGAMAAGEGDPKQADAGLSKLVNQAIERGAKWLAAQQGPDGQFPSVFGGRIGPTALATLALLHSGVPKDDPGIVRAIEVLRRGWTSRQTYDVSIAVMVLAERGRTAAGFTLPEADLKWMQEMVDWLVSVQTGGGGWRYPDGGVDHSNSQYALLALKEARKSGLRVPTKTFVEALEYFVSAQESSGPAAPRYRETGGDGVYGAQRERESGTDRARGFGYQGPAGATGSMTAAGVAAVAVATSEVPEVRHEKLLAEGRQAIRDGIAWLGRNFRVDGNPNAGATWHYYYLYGLERAGVLAGVVYMGESRWYAEGAKYLVDAQSPDGAWRSGMFGPAARQGRGAQRAVDVTDACFALLFLTRATARALGVATEQPLIDLTGAGALPDAEFGNLLDAAFAELGGLAEDRRAARAQDFALLGPRVMPPLLARLHATEEIERRLADLVLRAVTGLSMNYDAAAPIEQREAAADEWTLWYLRNRDRLALDPAAKRIR